MKYDCQYQRGSRSFDSAFGRVIVATDGGYERGYEAGMEQGYEDGYHAGYADKKADTYNDGYTKGKADGYEAGYAAGYETGYAKGYADGEAAGYARGHSEGNAEGYTEGYTEGEQTGYDRGVTDGVEQGKQAEYDRFWDAFQENGKRTDYTQAFHGTGWNDTTFKPKYDIVAGQWDNSLFSHASITDLRGILETQGVSLDASKAVNGTSWFHGSKVTHIPPIDARNMTSCSSMFNNCDDLQEVELNNIREDMTGNAQVFQMCTSLVTLKFTGTIAMSLRLDWSPLLTNESVQSIIDCLKDLTGQTPQKIQFHTDVLLKLTEEQVTSIGAKNWAT